MGDLREEVGCALTCKHAYLEPVTFKTNPLIYTRSLLQSFDARGTAPLNPAFVYVSLGKWPENLHLVPQHWPFQI